MQQQKQCKNCAKFIEFADNPDQSSGNCKDLMAWYEKHRSAGTKPSPLALENVYRILGGKFGESSAIFWPDSDRNRCKKYDEKIKK